MFYIEEDLINELLKKENRELTRKICKINRGKQLFLEVSNTGAYEVFVKLKLSKMNENELKKIKNKIKKRA